METLKKWLTPYLITLKKNGFLSVCYAVLAEALVIGFLAFGALFTIETLLPTFVTVRFSLTLFFGILILLASLLSVLGHFLDISFTLQMHKKNPWLWLGLVWILGILLLSLYKFPLLTIPLIIISFFLVGFLFWKIFFGQDEATP